MLWFKEMNNPPMDNTARTGKFPASKQIKQLYKQANFHNIALPTEPNNGSEEEIKSSKETGDEAAQIQNKLKRPRTISEESDKVVDEKRRKEDETMKESGGSVKDEVCTGKESEENASDKESESTAKKRKHESKEAGEAEAAGEGSPQKKMKLKMEKGSEKKTVDGKTGAVKDGKKKRKKNKKKVKEEKLPQLKVIPK